MPFFWLLLILSLIIIMPMFFIIRAKKQSQNQPVIQQNMNTQLPTLTINLGKLPHLFQQIIMDIEAQFTQIQQKNQQNNIINENYFVAKQLFYQRLPEMVTDYLKLEPNYAKNHIIDTQKNLTSYAILQQQLKSILNIFYQMNQMNNQLYLQNILTNQRYLQSISEQTGIKNDALTQNIQQNFALNHTEPSSDYYSGLQYLRPYVHDIHQKFSRKFVEKIGELFYFASITQLAVSENLGYDLKKIHIHTDLRLEALANLLNYQLPTLMQKNTLISEVERGNFEKMLMGEFDKMIDILEQMLAILDTGLPVADRLALIQNLHDDFTEMSEKIFPKK
ncbi:hypothetical protein [Faucicola boevrei]|uniref:hypothetical protein n=1 Tax=Faucicola boevrei TaxID=346665 RepID=UPI000367EC89|nr:hypothetical protein [Moraxella boevrei]